MSLRVNPYPCKVGSVLGAEKEASVRQSEYVCRASKARAKVGFRTLLEEVLESLAIEGEQNMPPQNMPLRHIDYFEPKVT